MVWIPDIEIIDGNELVDGKLVNEKHRDILRFAYINAYRDSEDNRTKVGAIIVKPNLISYLAWGVNHFPEGLSKEEIEKNINDSAWKYEHIIHAEDAAINSAAREGNRIKGAVMYLPWIPCTPCAKRIIDSGIETLIGHKELILKTTERWHKSTDYALALMKEAGVKLKMYDGKIGGVSNLFDGKEWQP